MRGRRAVPLALALALPAHAQEVSGFVELRASVFAGVDGEAWQLVERARPTFEAPLHDRWRLATTVELALVQGRDLQDEVQRTLDDSDLGPLLDLAQCTWPDHANERLSISEVGDYLSVERLYVDTYQPAFDLRVGRQALQWGSAQFINPTDPFPEVLFTEPYRPRAGVNAARLTVPVADRHQVQAVVGTDDVFRHIRLAGRGTVNVAQTDVSLVGAYREENDELLAGLDLRGTLGVGFWLEGALHVDLTGASADPEPYEEIAVGIDYSFPVLEQLVVAAQYYRNGAGRTDATSAAIRVATGIEPPTCDEDLSAYFPEPSDTDRFASPFTGVDYALLTALAGVTQDLTVTATLLQNLGDGSALVVPTIGLRPAGAVEISMSAQLPVATWGDGGELAPSDDDLRLAFAPTPDTSIDVDASGLVPDASVFAWTRFSF